MRYLDLVQTRLSVQLPRFSTSTGQATWTGHYGCRCIAMLERLSQGIRYPARAAIFMAALNIRQASGSIGEPNSMSS